MGFGLRKKVTGVNEEFNGTSCTVSGEGDSSILTAVTSQDSEGEERPRSRSVRSSQPECVGGGDLSLGRTALGSIIPCRVSNGEHSSSAC